MARHRIRRGRVPLVRLRAGLTEETFESALRARVPALEGSLLTWLHDDWYALATDVRPALKLAGLDADRSLEADGAVGLMTVDAPQFVELLAMRSVAGDAVRMSVQGEELRPPVYPWPAEYQGRPIQVDWHLGAVGILEAWDMLGDLGPEALGAVKVGHIDTGFTPHPALGFGTSDGPWVRVTEGRNLWKRRVNAADFGEVGGAYELGRPEYDEPRDNLGGSHGGHGTRTASTIAGLFVPAEGSAHPFFGAAPGASIVPYRITDSVFVDHVPELLAAAIREAVDRGCQVITICLGAIRPSKRVARAIDHAYIQGVIVCAAAGNVIQEVIYPGRFNRVVTIGGATTRDGVTLQPWPGASRGPYVDVSAPSDRIRRATTVLKRGAERYLVRGPGDGTSFGTSLCSGIAVLWLAHRGQDLRDAYADAHWARVAAFKRLLKQTATVPPGWDTANYGAGVAQAGRLLQAALPPLASLHHEAEAWEPFDSVA